ncbi:MAG TPA: hypothetical protein VF820_06575 [Patescibacteria group bacterium]
MQQLSFSTHREHDLQRATPKVESGMLSSQELPNKIAPFQIEGLFRLSQLDRGNISLAELLEQSRLPQHRLIAQLSKSVTMPEHIPQLLQMDQRILQGALLIRALDKGMQIEDGAQNLSLRQKFALFVQINNDESRNTHGQYDWYPAGVSSDLYLDSALEVRKMNSRYQRFTQYVDALWQVFQSRPNILVFKNRGHGFAEQLSPTVGTFTEYDFWVMQQIQKGITTRGVNLTQLALEAPDEFRMVYRGRFSGFRTIEPRSNEDLELAFEASYRKLHDEFGMFADGMKQSREAALISQIGSYLYRRPDKTVTLTRSVETIALECGVTVQAIYLHLDTIKANLKRGERFVPPVTIEHRTIAIAEMIEDAIQQLDRPGHIFRYGHYGPTEISSYITQQLAQVEATHSLFGQTISIATVSRIITDYMAAANPIRAQFPNVGDLIPEVRYAADLQERANIVAEDLAAELQRRNFALTAMWKDRLLHTGKSDFEAASLINDLVRALGLSKGEETHLMSNARRDLRAGLELLPAMPQS